MSIREAQLKVMDAIVESSVADLSDKATAKLAHLDASMELLHEAYDDLLRIYHDIYDRRNKEENERILNASNKEEKTK